MAGMAGYIVKLTWEEREMVESLLNSAAQEHSSGGWEPAEWDILKSAQRKVANANPDISGQGGRSGRGPHRRPPGIRGVRR